MSYNKPEKLHIVAITAVIANRKGRFLILKRNEQAAAFPGLWSLPGGKIERRENVDEALKREVMEETGLKIKPGKIFLNDAAFTRPDGQTAKVFCFLCEVENPDELKVSGDFSDHKWLSPQELKTLPHIINIDRELGLAEQILKTPIDLNLIKIPSGKKG